MMADSSWASVNFIGPYELFSGISHAYRRPVLKLRVLAMSFHYARKIFPLFDRSCLLIL